VPGWPMEIVRPLTHHLFGVKGNDRHEINLTRHAWHGATCRVGIARRVLTAGQQQHDGGHLGAAPSPGDHHHDPVSPVTI
jgi:hypothetical protein